MTHTQHHPGMPSWHLWSEWHRNWPKYCIVWIGQSSLRHANSQCAVIKGIWRYFWSQTDHSLFRITYPIRQMFTYVCVKGMTFTRRVNTIIGESKYVCTHVLGGCVWVINYSGSHFSRSGFHFSCRMLGFVLSCAVVYIHYAPCHWGMHVHVESFHTGFFFGVQISNNETVYRCCHIPWNQCHLLPNPGLHVVSHHV